MKYTRASLAHVAAVTFCIGLSTAQNCTSTISATSYPAPSLAPGWGAHIIADGFVKPRSMKLDSGGHLLVVDQDPDTGSGGIWRLTFEGEAPCLTVSDRTQIIANGSLNHGIEFDLLSGRTILYASSQEAVYAWDYEPETGTVTSDARRVINLGGNGSHATRTLLMPPLDPEFLLVSWGSDGNVDPQARDPSTGYSTVKAFNITDPSVVWDYAEDGVIVGWGLRNSVGLAQNPLLSGIWSNENNIDDLTRDGEDIVEDNPAEELNFHGFLSEDGQVDNSVFGGYFGYPDCYPAWDAEDVPNNDDIVTGEQFAANFNASIDDEWCAENTIDPVLSFTAHMAPMDMEFTGGAETLFITFRGSWNRENPAGYKLAAIPFSNETGMPIASPDSREGYVEIMTNEDLSACPDECFRPVGLEWSDYRRQLFMAADASGEIYIVYRTDNSSVNDFVVASSAATGPSEPGSNETTTDSSGGNASATASSEGGAQSLDGANWWAAAVIGLGVAYLL